MLPEGQDRINFDSARPNLQQSRPPSQAGAQGGGGFNMAKMGSLINEQGMPLMMAAALMGSKPRKGEEMNLIMPLMFMHMMGQQNKDNGTPSPAPSQPQPQGPQSQGLDAKALYEDLMRRLKGMNIGPTSQQQPYDFVGPPAPGTNAAPSGY